MTNRFESFLHRYATTLVFVFMVACFTAVAWKLASDSNRIDAVVTAKVIDDAKHEYNDCLERNKTKASISVLVGLILRDPSIPADQADAYKKLLVTLEPDRCVAPQE